MSVCVCVCVCVCFRNPRQVNLESSIFHRILEITLSRTSLPYFYPPTIFSSLKSKNQIVRFGHILGVRKRGSIFYDIKSLVLNSLYPPFGQVTFSSIYIYIYIYINIHIFLVILSNVFRLISRGL